jgi:hypothetical protein
LSKVKIILWTTEVLIKPDTRPIEFGNIILDSISIGNTISGEATADNIKQSIEFGNITREAIEYDHN